MGVDEKKVAFTIDKCRRRIGKQAWCRYFKSPCKNNPNCIWKQFEREQNRRIELENVNKNIKNILKSELELVKDYNGEILCLQVRISKLKKIEELLNETAK